MNNKFYFINKNLVIVITLLLVINCFLYFLYVQDIEGKLQRLRQQEKFLREELEKAEEKAFRAKKILKNLQEIKKELEDFYSQILGHKEERILKILQQIDNLVAEYNLPKKGLSFNHKQLEKEKLIQFEIVFPLRGNYSDIRNFIRQIENSPYFLIINRIELINPDKTQDDINLNVHLQTYFSTLS